MAIFKFKYEDTLRIEFKRKYYEKKLRKKIKRGQIDLDHINKYAPDAMSIFKDYSNNEQRTDFIEADSIKNAIHQFYTIHNDMERKRYKLICQPIKAIEQVIESWFKVYFSIVTSDRFSILDIKKDYISSSLYKEGARNKCCEKYKHLGRVIVHSVESINKKYDRLLICNEKINKENICPLLTPQEIEKLSFDDLTSEQRNHILENGDIEYFVNKGIIKQI